MAKSPAFSFYAGDFLSDTLHLTCSQAGAYIRMLATAWRGIAGLPQCYLPSDADQLARIVGMTREQWARASGEVLKLWEQVPEVGALRHKRLVAELEKQKERSSTARESAEIRWRGKAQRGSDDPAPARRSRGRRRSGDEDEMAKLAERSESMREELSRNPNPASVTVGAEPQNDLERAAFKKLRSQVRSMVKNLTLPEELRTDILDEIKGLTTVTELRAAEFAAKQTAARFALDAANEKAAAGQ